MEEELYQLKQTCLLLIYQWRSMRREPMKRGRNRISMKKMNRRTQMKTRKTLNNYEIMWIVWMRWSLRTADWLVAGTIVTIDVSCIYLRSLGVEISTTPLCETRKQLGMFSFTSLRNRSRITRKRTNSWLSYKSSDRSTSTSSRRLHCELKNESAMTLKWSRRCGGKRNKRVFGKRSSTRRRKRSIRWKCSILSRRSTRNQKRRAQNISYCDKRNARENSKRC